MNIDSPSITKFRDLVELKDFKAPTKKEYVRCVRRLGDHFQSDPATLCEDQLRQYFLFLRQHKKFSGSAMSIARAALQIFFREQLGHAGWKVFSELVIRRGQPLPLNTQPVGSGEKALGYLAAYVQRTALSSQRIVKEEHGKTTFKYRARDDHGSGGWKWLTLDTPEFLRRFLQHVLPAGFHRVRYFGWWSPAAQEKWARILALLDWQEPPRPPKRPAWVMTCPGCGKPMTRLGLLLPCRPP